MEKKVKVFRVYSNFGNSEYAFCKTQKEAEEKIEKAVAYRIERGSLDSEEVIRLSYSYEATLETEEDADYLLNF